MARYAVGDDVIVHTQNGRQQYVYEWPGKVTAVARKYATIEYVFRGNVTSGQFDMETGYGRVTNNYSPGTKFETPQAKELRLRAKAAIEVIEEHGFATTPFVPKQPSHEKIIAVAEFLKREFPKEE